MTMLRYCITMAEKFPCFALFVNKSCSKRKRRNLKWWAFVEDNDCCDRLNGEDCNSTSGWSHTTYQCNFSTKNSSVTDFQINWFGCEKIINHVYKLIHFHCEHDLNTTLTDHSSKWNGNNDWRQLFLNKQNSVSSSYKWGKDEAAN